MLLAVSGVGHAVAQSTTFPTHPSVQMHDDYTVDGSASAPAAAAAAASVPVEIQWLVQFIVDHGLDMVRVQCISLPL